MKKLTLIQIVLVGLLTCITGCIEDGVTTAPSAQPRFSVDTLALGTVFTGEGTPTAWFKVFNPNSKSINISRIAMSDDTDNLFRINVDGLAGKVFSDVEIREGDSIFVFVEASYPDLNGTEPTEYEHHIDFTTNGVTTSLPITATAVDATRLTGVTLEADTRFDASRPYIIYDSLTVAEGVRLTLAPGTKLHFHDGAALNVDGTLIADGTPNGQVEMTGDRWGSVVGRVEYEIMSGQWEGVYFSPSSRGNRLEYTSIRNTSSGVVVDSVPYTDEVASLYMLNCQLRNSKQYALLSSFSAIEAYGCEIADASAGVMALQGGTARMVNCTIANYYLFTALGGPAIQLFHVMPDDPADTDLPLLKATFDNCIIYGNGTELSHTDLKDSEVTMRRCLLKSEGSDDDYFISCLWGEDPLYYTVREDYHFDYRVKPESPAIGAADPELMPQELTIDRYGVKRMPAEGLNPTLGAYSSQDKE